jgi:hypothetical protein
MMVGGRKNDITFILVLTSTNHKTNQGLYRPMNNIVNSMANRNTVTSFMRYKPGRNYIEKRIGGPL